MRWLWVITSCVSLLLALGVAVVWVRSYQHVDHAIIGKRLLYVHEGVFYLRGDATSDPVTKQITVDRAVPGFLLPCFVVLALTLILSVITGVRGVTRASRGRGFAVELPSPRTQDD
jgi:hypothetical protein